MAAKKAKARDDTTNGEATPAKHRGLSEPWKPGQSGNPAGRPKGSRNKLNEDFIAALSEDFQTHGKSVIQTVRSEQPGVYLKVVASLQPKEIDVRDKTLEDLTDSEIFDALASIRSLKAGLDRTATGKDRKLPGRKSVPLATGRLN